MKFMRTSDGEISTLCVFSVLFSLGEYLASDKRLFWWAFLAGWLKMPCDLYAAQTAAGEHSTYFFKSNLISLSERCGTCRSFAKMMTLAFHNSKSHFWYIIFAFSVYNKSTSVLQSKIAPIPHHTMYTWSVFILCNIENCLCRFTSIHFHIHTHL